MSRTLRFTLLAALAALLAGSRPAGAAVRLDPLQRDSSRYEVYFRDRLLGTEAFKLKPAGDSVVIESDIDQMLPGPNGDEKLEKRATMVIKILDYSLLGYVSEQDFLRKHLLRAVTFADTTLTTYREVFPAGSAETYARPPGRIFIIDSQVFVLFDLMMRSLHGRLIGERTLPVVVLSEPRDTVLDITIRPGENETIQMRGVTRPARRVTLSDGASEFVVWVSPQGSMLRLTQPATGLRVDREMKAPARKPAAKPAAGAGSGAKSAPAGASPPKPPPAPAKPPTPTGR